MNKKDKTIKELDAWSEVFVFDPLASIFFAIIKRTRVHPLVLTFSSLFFGFISFFLIILYTWNQNEEYPLQVML